MSQSGAYAPGTVNDVTLEVYVNGVLREHQSVEFAGDIPGGLPSQVVSTGTGMLSRTGSISWAAPGGLLEEAHHPIRQEDGWPPRKGDRVQIDAVVNGVRFRRFTGRLDRTTGGIHDGTLRSEITDTLGDHLQGSINIPPRLPGLKGQAYRVAWEALEQCRLGLLPPLDDGGGDVIAHLTPQGDTWATVGETGDTSAATSTRDVVAGLDVWTDLPCLVDGNSLRQGRSVLAIARGSTQHNSSVQLSLTDGTEFRLEHDIGGALRLYVNNALIRTGEWEEPGVPILALCAAFGFAYMWTSRSHFLSTAMDPTTAPAVSISGDKVAATHLRYLSSTEATEVVNLCPAQPASLQIPPTEAQNLRATRGFENVPAKSVVGSWGESVLASAWMDEFGQTRVESRAVMLARPVQRYVRLSERAFGGSWTLGEDDVYSGVVVSGKTPLVRKSASPSQPRINIYQEESSRTITEHTVEERFIEAEPEVDWGPVDTAARHAYDGPGGGSMPGDAPSRGTWIHAVTLSASTEDPGGEWWIWHPDYPGGDYQIQIEPLGQRALKITETVTVPSGRVAYLKSPALETNTALRPAYRDLPSPIIRAEWAVTWANFTRKAGGGPSYGPTLEHEVDWWLTPSDAQKLASALAAEVTVPQATLSSTPLLWDPRRQVGDLENWWAQDRDGNDTWLARVLIVGYRETWDGHVPSQSVDARVISVTDPNSGTTYKDLSAAYDVYLDIADSGGTYDQVYDALPSTY